MTFLFYVFVYITILCGFIFLLLFGQNEMFKGTIIESIHWFVTTGALQYLLKFYKFIFKKDFNTENKIFKAIFKFRHRFIQLFYLSISLGGILLFFSTALHRLPNQFLGPIHFIIMPIVIAFIYVSFYVACVSNPGYVTKENVNALCQHFKYDHILYSERTCDTCQLQKPARSKHCSTCGHCIAKSDHHCSWINNCVGYLNFRYFLLFLLSNVVISVYGCYLCIYLIKDKAASVGLDKGIAYNRFTHKYEKINTKQYLLIMFNEEPILCALIIFLGASALVVLGFGGYQTFLSGVDGMTTNELAKWGRLEGRLEHGETFITKTYIGDTEEGGEGNANKKDTKEGEKNNEKNDSGHKNSSSSNKTGSGNKTGSDKEGVRKRKGGTAVAEPKGQGEKKRNGNGNGNRKQGGINMEEFYEGMVKNGYRYTTIRSVEDLENRYNQGVKKNFQEIFFPDETLF